LKTGYEKIYRILLFSFMLIKSKHTKAHEIKNNNTNNIKLIFHYQMGQKENFFSRREREHKKWEKNIEFVFNF